MDYIKRKDKEFIKELEKSSLQITKIQKYFPLYSEFFQLNSTNFLSVDFNHTWNIQHILTVLSDNVISATVKHNELERNVDVFCKYGTLLDPFKYMIGKYNIQDPQLFLLPTLDNTTHPKINSIHNATYVDSLFLYLSSYFLLKICSSFSFKIKNAFFSIRTTNASGSIPSNTVFSRVVILISDSSGFL